MTQNKMKLPKIYRILIAKNNKINLKMTKKMILPNPRKTLPIP